MTNVPPLLRRLPEQHFPVIVADVPWAYKVRSDKGLGRSAERHYRTMSIADIEALPVARFAARDARLLFWVTGPFFAVGAHVPIMRAWGFEPVSVWGVWAKPLRHLYQNEHGCILDDHVFEMMMGHTSRQNCEFVVEGRRGSPPKRLSRSVRQLFLEPARQHSRKPEKFYENVERYCAGPYLELFGRQRRPGWIVRGDQIGMFDRKHGG